MKKIRDLEPGTRFRYPSLDRTATLVSLHVSGARVLFDNAARSVAFEADTVEGAKPVAFETPGKPTLVDDSSLVEVI